MVSASGAASSCLPTGRLHAQLMLAGGEWLVGGDGGALQAEEAVLVGRAAVLEVQHPAAGDAAGRRSGIGRTFRWRPSSAMPSTSTVGLPGASSWTRPG
jgi:hypothetical protein